MQDKEEPKLQVINDLSRLALKGSELFRMMASEHGKAIEMLNMVDKQLKEKTIALEAANKTIAEQSKKIEDLIKDALNPGVEIKTPDEIPPIIAHEIIK